MGNVELLRPQILTIDVSYHTTLQIVCKQSAALTVTGHDPKPKKFIAELHNSRNYLRVQDNFFAAFLHDWHVMRIAFIVLLCLCFERLSALSLTCNYFLPSFLEHLKARAIIWSYCVLKPMRGFPMKCTKGVVHFYTILWGKIIHFPTWDIHL